LTFAAQQSRVDALIRLVGLIIIIFGAIWLYFTYSNVSVVASEIVTINYVLGLLLLVVGLFAAFAKFK
jgi:membrane-bound ClpP family serine protease